MGKRSGNSNLSEMMFLPPEGKAQENISQTRERKELYISCTTVVMDEI
jgi:hypothetical protein